MTFCLSLINRIDEARINKYNQQIKQNFPSLLGEIVRVEDIYIIDKSFSPDDQRAIAEALTNKVFESSQINSFHTDISANWVVEIGVLPGVTDNVGKTVQETIKNVTQQNFALEEKVYSLVRLYFDKVSDADELKNFAKIFYNPAIQYADIIQPQDKNYSDFDTKNVKSKVSIKHQPAVDTVDILNMTDEELVELGEKGIKNPDGSFRGPLALSLSFLKVIREYFEKKGRNPRDIELESLAQMWSEHCRHTIFSNPIDDIEKGIYRTYIKRATEEIREKKREDDFCVSVFSDNAGGIVFNDEWIICDKMETHNSPSALDPLGGAMTGIVGVNRDILGFGKGAQPVINRYGFCVGTQANNAVYYRDKNKKTQTISPKNILRGVVAGVEEGGNQSGIPSPQGFLYFHDRYAGKPLVFAGTVGLIPRQLNHANSWQKQARPGDSIIVAGGRVGADGIHGATFSSVAIDDFSPVSAVQIGDPITQKKLSDTIVRELRDTGYIHSIHDCGAGGISCAVSELGVESGGFEVYLERNLLKYENLHPWEIWVSESQERMCMAVPSDKAEEVIQIFARRGVEATNIGSFTDSGSGKIFYHNEEIYDMSIDFVEQGWPKEKQTTKKPNIPTTKPFTGTQFSGEEIFAKILSHENIASFAWVSEQYDHTVLGGAVVGPLQGVGKVNGSATVTRPVLSSDKAVVLSQKLNPQMSEYHAFEMAIGTVDDAIASAVAVGANIDHMALMDNFCWCSSKDPERLYQLKEAARGCYEGAVAYGTPFISGKDSMFNDFKGYDDDGKPIKVSVPPTLLISSISIIPEAMNVQTIDWKIAGDEIFLLGDLNDNISGSIYQSFLQDSLDLDYTDFPAIDTSMARERYRKIYQGHQDSLFRSIQHVHSGGLGTALALGCIASQKGIAIDASVSLETLFAEGRSRFVVSVAADRVKNFRENFPQATKLGVVDDSSSLKITSLGLDMKITDLTKAYRGS